jgi:hypothetical protein
MLPATRRIRESAVQAYIVQKVKEAGHFAVKIESPSRRGLPDLLIIIRGSVYFCEVKMATRSKPTVIQSLTHREMIAAGAMVSVVKGKQGADAYLAFLSIGGQP